MNSRGWLGQNLVDKVRGKIGDVNIEGGEHTDIVSGVALADEDAARKAFGDLLAGDDWCEGGQDQW